MTITENQKNEQCAVEKGMGFLGLCPGLVCFLTTTTTTTTTMNCLIKYMTQHLPTQHRLAILNMNQYVIKFKQSFHYRHVGTHDFVHLTDPSLISLAQNPNLPTLTRQILFYYVTERVWKIDVIRVLVDHGVDPLPFNTCGEYWASQNGHLQVMRW